MSRRTILLWFALLALTGIILYQMRSQFNNPKFLPPVDFVEYYAAGQLNLEGQNPYDPELLLPIQERAGNDKGEAVMMWNPPWTLPFVMPFGMMSPRISQLLFVVISLVFILISVDGLWREFGGDPSSRWIAWIGAVCFVPTLFVITAGQISAFLLLGAYLFMYLHRRHYYFLAGMVTLLMAIKPHLFTFVWLAMLWEGRWRVWLGGIVAGLVAMAIALSTNPDVWMQFRDAMTNRPPAEWQSPTFGAALRMIFGVQHFSLQFLPLIPGMIWFLWRYRMPWRSIDWTREMPVLILASFLTATYGAWIFDLVVLALPLTYLAVRSPYRQRFFVIFAVIMIAFLILNQIEVSQFWFLWVTPVCCLAYLLLAPPKDSAPVTATP